MIDWIGHGLSVQPSKMARGILFSLLYFIFFKYETIVRSSARFFGHSDPDLSSVRCNTLFIIAAFIMYLYFLKIIFYQICPTFFVKVVF